MKGIYGLMVAIALGIAGALLNFVYLTNKSQDFERIHFIGIKPERTLSPGQRVSQEDLEAVPIPAKWARNLDDYAVPYVDRQTVIGANVYRKIDGGTLLLQEDLKTPPPELKFEEDERAWPIPVDTKRFVPSLVVPGDLVSFLGSSPVLGYPTPAIRDSLAEDPAAATESGPVAAPAVAPGSPTVVGPFRVLALGNRLGSAEVMRAAKIPQTQENVVLIRVKVQGDGSFELRAQQLWKLLESTNFRPMGVQLHPRQTGKR
ncbi:MAG: hypothetical protein A2V70_14100 [Planctomycetes bacterium RBG_13_63_9]|nr:MAG: hypothetical protein A2V70_14100 [Planctomycetes bacterium RBG_13_63_9]